MKRLLLTGVAGFIGSHIVDEVLTNTDWEIVGIASWQHKGMPQRLLKGKHYEENKGRVTIITHDLQAPLNPGQEKEIGHIDYVINCASESHVDRSITDPVSFTLNNVSLELNVLELCRRLKPEKIIQVSTDEVYGDAPEGVNYKEWSAIVPSNPYSASKAAQEAIAISYWRTYELPIVITNTMNNLGEKQDLEKFLVKLIKNSITGELTRIHSNPEKTKAGSRSYLHARNHANALVWILNNVEVKKYPEIPRPERFNIVGAAEVDNLTMAKLVYEYVKKLMPNVPPLNIEMENFHGSRPGHDLRYSLDGTKIKELGYTYPKPFEASLEKTVEWYVENKEWLGL